MSAKDINQVLFRETEVAAMLGVHRATIRSMRHEGKIQHTDTAAGVRYTAWQVAEYLKVPVEKLLEHVRG